MPYVDTLYNSVYVSGKAIHKISAWGGKLIAAYSGQGPELSILWLSRDFQKMI